MNLRGHFGVIILLSVLLAFLFPTPGLLLQPYLKYLLMMLMFVSCLKIYWSDIIKYLKDVKHLVVMLLVIHVVTAIIALVFSGFLSEELFLGLIIVAVVPSGLSVVFLCDLCKGKPADALTITSISNLLSPITVPALVLLFAGAKVTVNPITMFWLIIQLIVFPFIAAQIVNYIPGKEKVSTFIRNLAIPLLIVIIWTITATTRDIILADPLQAFWIFLVISVIILIGFFAGWFFGKEHKQSITYAITGSYKNFTLATVLALTLFNPIVALPSVIYTIANNVWLAPMHLFIKWRETKKKK